MHSGQSLHNPRANGGVGGGIPGLIPGSITGLAWQNTEFNQHFSRHMRRMNFKSRRNFRIYRLCAQSKKPQSRNQSGTYRHINACFSQGLYLYFNIPHMWFSQE
jgi:hypothetical protein